MTPRDLHRRLAELEDELLRGPRDEAQAADDAERIALALEEMDRVTFGTVEPVDRRDILERMRQVRGLDEVGCDPPSPSEAG